MKTELIKKFKEQFDKEPQQIFFCPGRVNLIGEHIDYNGGQVMPCAITQGTYLAVSKTIDKQLRFRSLDFSETADLHLQQSYSRTGKEWFNYPLGIINHFALNNFPISGLDMLFTGDLPVGTGLSSSASVEVLTAFALDQLFGYNVSKVDLAILSKKVENEFIGVNCGIMDQFAVAMGKKDNAILLNCDTLDYEYLPFNTPDHFLVIINSNKQRKLVDSKYNERFTECGLALKALKKELDVKSLCEIDINIFDAHRHLINNPVLEKRALHVITESKRVEDAAQALKGNDFEKFGQLMYASHQSLKEQYEVTGKELDTIVDFCKTYDGCIGARMTGAGFGGCAIALVEKNKFDNFSDELNNIYLKKTGILPTIFFTNAADGVRELPE